MELCDPTALSQLWIYRVPKRECVKTYSVSLHTGHVHLTDFNIAAIVKDDLKATSIAGTKPYMGKKMHLDRADAEIQWTVLRPVRADQSQQ